MKNLLNSFISTRVLRYSALAALTAALALPAAAGDTGRVTSLSTESLQQAGKTIKGVVKDETGEPMIGVTVSLGGGRGTITDLDGQFTLAEVKETDVITISYVGYKDVVLPVKGKAQFDIKLQPDNQLIDEVVVIGYGVQKKSNVTGAISSLKADDMKNNSMTNAAQALQGKVSGVQVVNNSGAPGANPTIRVRGYSSNGSSDPLYIVDGLKVDDISYLDPNSIKSMEILKDAASAAIYGAEAGNGVVLITTKAGDKGKTQVTLDAQFIFSSLANKVDLMNAEQYIDFYGDALGDAFTVLQDTYYIDGTDTDWQDEMFETGTMQKYNLTLSGGNDNGTFFFGLGYMKSDGMVKLDNDYYKRLTGQINASYKIRPWLEIGTSNTIMSSTSSTLSESNNQYGLLKDILLMDPLTPVYYDSDNLPANVQEAISNGMGVIQDDKGRYYGLSYMLNSLNPLGAVDISEVKYKSQSVNGSAYINLTPIKNFIFTSRLGYTIGSVSDKEYTPRRWTSIAATSTDTDLSLTESIYTTRYYQWENFANYTWETKSAGNFGFMAGMSYSDYEQEYAGGQTNELSSEADNFIYLNYSTNTSDDYVLGGTTYRRKIAYYGRLSWDFMDRYNVQVNFRADSYDTAYLDFDHKWGYFPSVSIGWTFSEEDFMKKLVGETFTYGKLRASYGVNGSISNLGSYAYAATLKAGMYDTTSSIGNMAYWLNGELVTGVYPNTTQANPKLRWERSKQFDVGLDLRFFDNRLSLTADYYYKKTDGLLVQSTASLMTGYQYVYQNVGEVINKGLELELDWKGNIGDFKYGVKANFSTLSNNVKEYLGEGARIDGSSILSAESPMTYFEEGYPLWYIRGYKITGVDSTTGQATFADLDNDGEITDSDRTKLGKAIPDFTYGLTLSASYKGFDLNIYGAGASGNKLIYGMMSASSDSYYNRPLFLYEDRWTSTNTSGSVPSATYQLNDSRLFMSDLFVKDASFFKIKQIQLGYTLPKSVLNALTMTNARVFVSLENFFTFTSYPGTDPETNASSYTASAMAFDYGAYPQAKSVMFGFNVAF